MCEYAQSIQETKQSNEIKDVNTVECASFEDNKISLAGSFGLQCQRNAAQYEISWGCWCSVASGAEEAGDF